MGAALLGGLLAGDGADPATLAVSEALAARRDELGAQFPGVAVTADVPPCTAAVIAVKPGDVAGGRAPARSPPAPGGSCRSPPACRSPRSRRRPAPASPSCGRCRTRRRSSGRARRRSPAAPPRPTTTWRGPRPSSAPSARSRASTSSTSTPSPRSPARARPTCSSSPRRSIDAGVAAGLPRPLATRLTTQLLVGSAALLADRGDPAALRAMVTSPAGTTAAGLHVLESRATRAAFIDAVLAAAARSRELGA